MLLVIVQENINSSGVSLLIIDLSVCSWGIQSSDQSEAYSEALMFSFQRSSLTRLFGALCHSFNSRWLLSIFLNKYICYCKYIFLSHVYASLSCLFSYKACAGTQKGRNDKAFTSVWVKKGAERQVLCLGAQKWWMRGKNYLQILYVGRITLKMPLWCTTCFK